MINPSQIKYVTLNDKDKIPIREFKLDELCENPSIVVLGKRGSGKSNFNRNILEKYYDIPATVISPTEQYNPFYCEIENVKNIHYKYDKSIIQNRCTEQKIVINIYNNNCPNLDSDSSDSELDNNEPTQLESSIKKFAPNQNHENNAMTNQMHELLRAIGGIVESSLTTDRLVDNDIDAMKKTCRCIGRRKTKTYN